MRFASLLVVLAACGTPDGLGLEVDDGTALRGQFTHDGVTVSFDVMAEGALATVDLAVNETTYVLTMDHDQRELTSNGFGAIFAPTEREAFKALGPALMNHHGPARVDELPARALERTTSYLAASPTGYAHDLRQIQPDQPTGDLQPVALGDDGVSCRDNDTGQVVRAYWDDNGGSWFADLTMGQCLGTLPANGGDYDCIGRCGPACGSWWAASAWTQDCYEHDVCSYYNAASGGSSDPNCGDEFNEAQDDWLWGIWSGCSGSRNPLGC
ncbi:MAG: hypothetical protein AAGA48_09580 [Myxococcota bacterium]